MTASITAPLTEKEAQLLLTLIQQGECASQPELEVFHQLGLWLFSEDKKTLIASKRLLLLRQTLNTDLDAVTAILATIPELQTAWANIVAAQLNDAATRNDVHALSEQITNLGGGAGFVFLQTQSSKSVGASLNPTDFTVLESFVFGQGAEQSASYPKLLRSLSTAAKLIDDSTKFKPELNELSPIDEGDVTSHWLAQRLIELPLITQANTKSHAKNDYHLSGLVQAPKSDLNDKQTIEWLVANPWVYLLAQIIYTQDIWRSEQVSGGLALEIEHSQIKHFMNPNAIKVVVTTNTGYEVSCGSLAELILRVLDALDVHLLTPLKHPLQIEALNAAISPVIGFMISAKVWQFIEGSSKDIPQYKTHSSFARIPTSRLGTINFARPSKHIAAAIREQAQSWANELVGLQT
ncbi:hypothetical protein AN391_02507 [Pseudoalteromonas sp. P1-13-1a]|uniref:hypothetical protein n=1 Tax=Pseudoalteromonas sp. P1-13-1a TaxID=1723756 RepID=UPI0006D66C4A|nr:hypothetical protein [Pseudoalteromonas sp. P1-13-1a]KPZ55750.1 hypothetical protein AN391_02507 [Pseudoalteromonas sp. P1-13-1a]